MAGPWQQLVVDIGKRDPQPVEALLSDAGADAITLTDGADTPVLEPLPGETPLWPEITVTALFDRAIELAPVIDALRALAGADVALRVDWLADRDWEREWLDQLRPTRFGRHLWVCPRGTRVDDAGAVVLTLDPGLAFGTGSHATTALCLEWLAGVPLAGSSVLDYGTGSGILGIAAILLGAAGATGVDIDPQSLSAAAANATANGVDADFEVCMPEELAAGRYDVIVANILAGTLCDLAPSLAEHAAPGAPVALTGILPDQADEVAALYAQWFDLQPPAERDGWVLLAGNRHP